jgi:GGDEF domain-containing protein
VPGGTPAGAVPGASPAGSAGSVADAARRGTGSQRLALAPSIADELTGLYDAAAWTSVLAAEGARWTRFHRPCQVIHVEVVGIAAVAERLGQAPAERLLALLSDVLRDETRQSDLYARSSRWRIQGVLPEQEPNGGPRYEERVRDGFRRRLGPDLPIGLLVGIATPAAGGGLPEALDAAERSMQPGSPLAVGVAPAVSAPAAAVQAPAPNRGQSTDVHDGLIELGRLREDGLVTDEEYRLKRAEILGRL